MNNRNAKTILLLSVVVPLGLLMVFKFDGLLGERVRISETGHLPAVDWELERPGGGLDLDPNYKAVNVFSDKEVSVYLEATPRDYDEDDSWAGGADVLSQRVLANISLTCGFLQDLRIVFTENAQLTEVHFMPSGGDLGTKLIGLRIDSYASSSYASSDDNMRLLKNNVKAFVNMSSPTRPLATFFEDSFRWYLLGSQNQTHEMQVTFEITYFNGTVYKRLMQPFNFKVSRDNNDSFETAQEITTGYYQRLYVGNYDLRDFYKLSVSEDQRLSILVNATSSPGPMFSVFLYDSAKNKIEIPSDPPFCSRVALTFVAPSTGFVFLEIRANFSYGFYSIRVDPA